MFGDDLRVTTAHLSDLAVEQSRAAAATRAATAAVDGAAAAVRTTHGVIASATASAVEQVIGARREAGTKMAAVSEELGRKLTEAATRYNQTDDAMGGAHDGQMWPR